MEKIYLYFPKKRGTISPRLYGALTEHIGGVFYDGLYVGRNSPVPNKNGFRVAAIEALKEAGVSVLRWPGGCFAECYDWRDGIGEQSGRPVRRGFWTSFDGRYENNAVGTDEFLRLCEDCGAEPYIAANITSLTPLVIRDWVDYCNAAENTTTLSKLRAENGHPAPYNVRLWGIGNECWGFGGNMTPESCAMEYRKYAAIIKNAADDLTLIGSGADAWDYAWTRKFLQTYSTSAHYMNALSFHYYCRATGGAVDFNGNDWYAMLSAAGKMEDMIERHYAAALSYGLENEAALCIDEWGCWHPEGSGPSEGKNLYEQQSTMRDAAVTALTLNLFNNHCEKIKIACVAQLVNNLHALFLASGDNFIKTPTFHVFKMFKAHQGGRLIETGIDAKTVAEGLSKLSVSASVRDGVLTLTAANLSATEDADISLEPIAGALSGRAEVTLLAADDMHAHNTFDAPEAVKTVSYEIEAFDGKLTIPHGGIVSVRVKTERNG